MRRASRGDQEQRSATWPRNIAGHEASEVSPGETSVGASDVLSDPSSIMVSMNRLTTEKRAQVIGSLVEGNSIRATVRMTGAAKNTVTKLLVDLGAACTDYPGPRSARPSVHEHSVRRDLGVLLQQAEERPAGAQGHIRVRRHLD